MIFFLRVAVPFARALAWFGCRQRGRRRSKVLPKRVWLRASEMRIPQRHQADQQVPEGGVRVMSAVSQRVGCAAKSRSAVSVHHPPCPGGSPWSSDRRRGRKHRTASQQHSSIGQKTHDLETVVGGEQVHLCAGYDSSLVRQDGRRSQLGAAETRVWDKHQADGALAPNGLCAKPWCCVSPTVDPPEAFGKDCSPSAQPNACKSQLSTPNKAGCRHA